MTHLRNLLLLSLILGFAFSTSGCGDDCDTYCRNQGNFIDECLPQFDQAWADLADGDWAKKSDFIGVCGDQIEEFILSDIEVACEDASDEDRKDCENTIRQGTVQICGEHVNDFTLSCTDYWSSTTNFTPGPFTPTPPTGDDDDSAGDDDDSAGDDDDSAADDDDDSPADDDDDSAADDDDDSAADDDDDSAADDDDSAAP
jgi:hypothetical protein